MVRLRRTGTAVLHGLIRLFWRFVRFLRAVRRFPVRTIGRLGRLIGQFARLFDASDARLVIGFLLINVALIVFGAALGTAVRAFVFASGLWG